MLVTRVEVEAPVCSFRYPHFLVGRQPTYEMPPPSTLYGHLCSAVGELVSPQGLALGLTFTYSAKADDLEHQILVEAGRGSLERISLPREINGGNAPTRLPIEGPISVHTGDKEITPVRREFLFDARLTLYVTGDWTAAFRCPRYAVVLGRSQDLASYRSVNLLELGVASEAYYEHTLLPWTLRPAVVRARAETMPRWIDSENRRQPYFDRFLIVRERACTNSPDHWIRLPGAPTEHWVDPDSPEIGGLRRGVWMHPLLEATQ